MKNILLALFALVIASAPAKALDIQAAIDALPSTGGVVEIPCGTHGNSGDRLTLKTNVVLRGEEVGCVKIPPVQYNVSGVRAWNVVIEDVTIDGSLASNLGSTRIGIDLREMTRANVRNVEILNVSHCIVLARFGTYYNSFYDVMCAYTNTGIEISEGANQNYFWGGNFGSSTANAIGIGIYTANGNVIMGTSLESSTTNQGIVLTGDALNYTTAAGVRIEATNWGTTIYKRFP